MKSLKYVFGALALVALVGGGCSGSEESIFGIASKDPSMDVNSAGYFEEVQKVKGDNTLVRPSDIIDSGQGIDGFPVITDPKFVTVSEMVDKNILFDELSGVSIKDGDTYKFYPHQVLAWHVVVEDEVNGEPVAVTFSQLTEVSKVFSRNIEGQTVSLGTSGLLWNNNVLLYDDATQTLWSQILGLGVYGENAGVELVEQPSVVMTWGQWSTAHPDGLVLSDDTGFTREYTRSPYGTYLTAKVILFPTTNDPVRALEMKSIVVGVKTDGGSKAYQEGPIVQFSNSVKNDVVGETDIVVWRHEDGGMYIHLSEDVVFSSVTDIGILDREGNEWLLNDELELVFGDRVLARAETIQTFWFMWSVLHPDSHMYGNVRGKGLIDGSIDLKEGEGVKEEDGAVHLDVNDPGAGGFEFKAE